MKYKAISTKLEYFNYGIEIGDIFVRTDNGLHNKEKDIYISNLVFKFFWELWEIVDEKNKLESAREEVERRLKLDAHNSYDEGYDEGLKLCRSLYEAAIKELQENKKISIERAKEMIGLMSVKGSMLNEKCVYEKTIKNWQEKEWVEK